MLDIYIDADGCPVKDEVYKVARRYGLQVFVVCNKPMTVPMDERIRLAVVSGRFDAADDWIVEHVGEGDIVVTADIPLASRSLEKGARVIGTKGHPFTEDSIGDALATRELMDQLRQAGAVRGGPAPMAKDDRSRFLSELDRTIQAVRRKGR
ncbi:MAG TPA: YaiI/YqxD family protein [Thermoanaerobaculia bacterium]|nr:YaiI/YqxD family protein [Thermoanaerobaculia bacterium]